MVYEFCTTETTKAKKEQRCEMSNSLERALGEKKRWGGDALKN